MSIERRNHGRHHSYYVDGRKLPGVTTITGATTSKDNLINWAAEETGRQALNNWGELCDMPPADRLQWLYKARYRTSDTAKDRGTEVHKLAARLVAGERVDLPDPIQPLVDNYVAFLDQMEPAAVDLGNGQQSIELVLANRAVGYCGTTDLIADMGGERWLLDLKTSGRDRPGVFPETALQVCAYMNAEIWAGPDGSEHKLADLGITRGGAVAVTPSGWDLFPLETGEEVFDYFRHLTAIYEAGDDLRGWVGAPAEPVHPYRTHTLEEVPW